MEESVKVYIRVRPPNQNEVKNRNNSKCLATLDEHSIEINYPRDTMRNFSFDFVFSEQSTQDEVYETSCSQLVNQVLQGYNATIFAYGQTGTGKTFTMGLLQRVTQKSKGIVPRALKDVFNRLDQAQVTLSFLQIYMENIYDLLNPVKKALKLREDKSGDVFVNELIQVPIADYNQAITLINAGMSNRVMGAHDANQTSSRSHTILMLDIDKQTQSHSFVSRFTMIDLAGSERVRDTSSKGIRLREAKFINTSLSALGKVISALSSNSTTHIPFRDSKLTRLLQPSFNGKVAVIATVTPSNVFAGETISTLQFASRCKEVVVVPIQANIRKEDTLPEELLQTIDNYKKREDYLLQRIKELETNQSDLFSHNQTEAVQYMFRLIKILTGSSIKYIDEVQKLRANLLQPVLNAVETEFPMNYQVDRKLQKQILEEFESDIELSKMPSSQLIENLQMHTQCLVNNLNFLGKCGVQNQMLKAKLGGIDLKNSNEILAEIDKDKTRINQFISKRYSNQSSRNLLLQSLREVVKQESKDAQNTVEKKLSIRQLIQKRKLQRSDSLRFSENEPVTERTLNDEQYIFKSLTPDIQTISDSVSDKKQDNSTFRQITLNYQNAIFNSGNEIFNTLDANENLTSESHINEKPPNDTLIPKLLIQRQPMNKILNIKAIPQNQIKIERQRVQDSFPLQKHPDSQRLRKNSSQTTIERQSIPINISQFSQNPNFGQQNESSKRNLYDTNTDEFLAQLDQDLLDLSESEDELDSYLNNM